MNKYDFIKFMKNVKNARITNVVEANAFINTCKNYNITSINNIKLLVMMLNDNCSSKELKRMYRCLDYINSKKPICVNIDLTGLPGRPSVAIMVNNILFSGFKEVENYFGLAPHTLWGSKQQIINVLHGFNLELNYIKRTDAEIVRITKR